MFTGVYLRFWYALRLRGKPNSMISAITGELTGVEEDRIHLQVGPILYELLIPAADAPLLQAGTGQPMTFHTLMYFEGDPSGGSLEPRLIGFLQAQDRQFFQKFITVKGIGPKKALKALIHPCGEIAAAIENRDTRFLVGLPTIGKRMAEQIIAELSGKVQQFVQPGAQRTIARATGRTPDEEDAIATLMALGDRRDTAEALLERAHQADPSLKTTQDLVQEMLRLRNVRA